jgi:hypothetical protein
MFFYVLKELRHLIHDIKLDTVLTINKPLTKTSRAVARGKAWRFLNFQCYATFSNISTYMYFTRKHMTLILNNFFDNFLFAFRNDRPDNLCPSRLRVYKMHRMEIFHPFCHRHLLYRLGSVSTVNFWHCFYILLMASI